MIEEKTKEPQSQAPAAPVKGREKLRSFWAKVQISGLLRRHRFRRKTQRHMNDVAKKLRASAVVLAVGEAFYALGFAAEYMVVRTGRGIAAVARRLARWCRNALHTIIATAFPGAAQMFKDLLAPLYLFFKGLGAVAAHANDVRRERGFGASVKAAGRYFVGGLKRNLSLLPRTAMYILPLCMLAVFVTVWNRTMAQPYALAVQVNGHTVGYVANEEVFNLAKEDVMQRINYAGSDKTELTIEPTYTITATHKTMDESETANAILQSASDQISEGTALYLDGELTAVCSDGDTLRSYLESLLAPYEDQTDENISVGFNKNVTLEDGVYFNDSFEDDNSIENMLTGVQQQEKIYTVMAGDTLWAIAQKNDLTFRELCALNPNFKGAPLTENSNIQEGDQLIVTKQEALLEVRITKVETREEEIPFGTETTQSNEYTKGTTKTLQEGENGLRRVTMQNVYDTNGALLEQTILSTETIREPVNKKVVVGTKKVTKYGAAAYIGGSGQFIWPVPGYRNCSRWYGSGHKGVDICASAGTPIYASAGGTVTKAGYNKAGAGTGYGYSVIISHSGGYTTVYAHCLSLAVSAGQTVRQGQLIGYVGSTGRSSGNHCHFEIRRNGSYIAPQSVFSGKR